MGTFLLTRTRTDAIYKTETTQNRERPILSWRVLRWAIIPAILLILLAATVYTIIWVSQDRPMEIKSNISSIEEGLLFDLEAHSSHTNLPGSNLNEENFVPNILNDLQEIRTEEELAEGDIDNSTDSSLGEEVSFIDRLISSFQENRPIIIPLNNSNNNEEVLSKPEGLKVKQFTSLGETGFMRRVPNGHKYGEYQSFPSMNKNFGMSTTALPVSPTLPSLQPKGTIKSTVPPQQPSNQSESNCHSPQLQMCRGIIPWDLTSVPSLPGISTMESLKEAMPYFELILESGCSQRAREFLCSLLEPECQPLGTSVTPPCRHTCRAVAEDCSDFIINILDLSQVFKCDNYPDSDDACINFARGQQCLSKEISCGDDMCIPKRWKCNGVTDCKNGMDEVNCTTCNKYQFSCESRDSCIPMEWKCDGNADCEDGSDEVNCQHEEEMVMHSHASPCPSGELRCVDGRCITLQQICDGNKDCSDGADEANCRIQYT